MNESELTARQWLRKNGYNDVADVIDEILFEWQEQGKKTRRNWWEVLSGGKDGKPRKIAGRIFPILKEAQLRQGLPVTESALSRSEEKPSSIRESNRWPKEVHDS